MVNKKLSRILGPVLGISGLVLIAGIGNTPVFAEESAQANLQNINNTTTSAAASYVNDYVNINKSVTQNGIKVTVDKAIATKHKLKVEVKVEGVQPIDNTRHENSIFMITYGEGEGHSFTGSSENYIDDKTMLLTLEKDNNEGEYPEKGNLRVDIVLSNYKVNIGIEAPVDFTNSFNNTINKGISGKIPTVDYSLSELEADDLGTTITYKEPKKDNDDRGDNSFLNPIILLKVGDKMYKTDSHGNYSGKDDEMLGNFETSLATYDKVKDEKNISIIPLTCNMTWEELMKQNKTNKEHDNINKQATNNVNYEKNFDFNDGSKGEIYKIERNDNSVKVYCKGTSEMEGLLMASNLRMFPHYVEGQKNNLKYFNNDGAILYKDPNEALGYIVEFDNVDKETAVDLSIDDNIKYIDRYKLNDEMKLFS